MRRNAFYAVVILIAVSSCSRQGPITLDELMQFVLEPEHGLIRSVTKNDITLEMTYRPKDLVIAQEAGISAKADWEQIKTRLDSLDYFVLKISRNGEEIQSRLAGDQSKFNKAVSYLSAVIGNDISLVVGEEVIAVEGFSFIPTFGISKGTSVLVIFKSYLEKRDVDFRVVFDDTMFGSGNNEFKFEVDDVKNVPRLQTQFE